MRLQPGLDVIMRFSGFEKFMNPPEESDDEENKENEEESEE